MNLSSRSGNTSSSFSSVSPISSGRHSPTINNSFVCDFEIIYNRKRVKQYIINY